MSDLQVLAPAVARALALIAARLSAEPTLPWLLAGEAAVAMQGVAMQGAPETLLLITGAPELGRVAALLAADEYEHLASRPAPGYAASPRGRFELKIENVELRKDVVVEVLASVDEPHPGTISQFTAVAVDLVGDAVATGKAGELSLALEHVWPLRVEGRAGDVRVPLLSLEIALAVALLQGQRDYAHAIADHLLATGVRWERLDDVLAALPALEQPLWELMDQVRPLARRARSRRARQQLGWGQGQGQKKRR